jgi:hypothetical protein
VSDRIEHVQLPQMAAATVFMAGPAGPAAVIDVVAVERAVTGHRDGARLTLDEARYAASLLLAAGYSARTTGRMVGVIPEKVQAWYPEKVRTIERTPVRCGTRRGYRAHRARGESPCRACRTAEASAKLHYRYTGSYTGAPEVAA